MLATGREMQTAREMTLRRGEVTGDPRRWERAEHRHVSLRHHLAEAQAREGGVFDVAEPRRVVLVVPPLAAGVALVHTVQDRLQLELVADEVAQAVVDEHLTTVAGDVPLPALQHVRMARQHGRGARLGERGAGRRRAPESTRASTPGLDPNS